MFDTKKQLSKLIAWIAVFVFVTSPVHAQYSSPNFRVDEAFFGTGGEVDMSSDAFRGQGSAGSLGVGGSESANFMAEAGFLTPSEPFLEMVVTGATVDFGTLSDTATAFGSAQGGDCNCSFYVRTYFSSEYTVVTMSDPPTNESGASLAAKTTTGLPSTDQSVEEFGMNLVANTSPLMGANPVNDPDGTFADGSAATGYDIVNQFKYQKGDIVARSPANLSNPGVGKTNYTVSYIAKRNNITPAGVFTMFHDLVAVPTF
jgi:hypothetical protein